MTHRMGTIRLNGGVVRVLAAAAVAIGAHVPAGLADGPAPFSGVALGLTAGTLGLGVEGSIKAADWLVLRANVGGFTYDHAQTVSSNTFEFKTSLVSAGLIADLHPFSGGFRISLGGRYHDMKLSGASAIGSVTIGDHTYSAASIGKLTGSIQGDTFVPYVGIGYDSAHFSQSAFSLSLDLGALYLGEPKSTLTTEKSVAGLDADLRKEETKINEKIGAFGFYPVVQLAAKYRF